MKKTNLFKKTPLAHFVAASLTAMSVGGVAYAAAPLAGEEIKNLATVSYEDENGNKYTAQSNEAVITVAPQYKATMENDNNLTGAPGQTVYFPHTLTNTGNIKDVFDLTADNVAQNSGATIYHDLNGNGQPDAGEPTITELEIGVGETENIVVAYQINGGASAGDVETIKFEATSRGGGTVTDIGTNTNTVNGDNIDIVTVSTGPVLVQTKESVLTPDNPTTAGNEGKVTYTLTIKNTGGADANAVDIIDAIPLVDHDGDNGDGTAGTTAPLPLTNVSIIAVNGLTGGTDVVPTTTTTMDENGVDLNNDGDTTDTAVSIIKATDVVLPKDTTISIVYEAEYDPSWDADALIENVFYTQQENPANPTDPKVVTPSNKTTDKIPQQFKVAADDDGLGTPSPAVNDGKDDNAADNDVQYIDQVVSGETAVFTHTIENTGNGDDIYNLAVAQGSFPSGTIFTLWSADGSTQLTDSDGDGKPDTGVVGGASETSVVVKAQLPAGTSSAPGTNHTAILTATSSGDTTVSDTTALTLGQITPPAVDLAAVGATQPNTGFKDDGTANAHSEGAVLNEKGNIGDTVSFPMEVANESGKSDSFAISSENVPAGWDVVFKDSAGNIITFTPLLPAGETFNFTAEVTISTDPLQALGMAPGSFDGIDSTIDNSNAADADNDGDNDYVMAVKVASATDSARNDSVKVAVDVNDSSAVSVTPDGQNQVQPGGTVEYPHTVKNDGNLNEAVELTSGNSTTGWNSTTLVDTTGDGVGDTEVGTLVVGDTIKVYNPDGTSADVVVTDSDTDNLVEFPLTPGQYIKVTDKVFAPANAPQGEVNTTTITATDPTDTGGQVRSNATDTSNVILGQVRLTKTVARQTDCTDTGTIGAFAEIQSAKVAPGECVVWEIVAKNEGDAKVMNVIVNDSIPEFTSFYAGSLMIGSVSKSDSAGDDEAEHDATSDKVTYYLGTGVDQSAALGKGGEMLSGESSTVRFTVKVDE
ncbi:MAG: Unknown protein [uncultured Thiotrichaceae bacterium]|uniref:DUF11 domain-containing protein n=1 Tax=uncultured Thiotrichaceae bacterium TaxID=298394 RepID=A0A6S6U4E7_9GAMM|nr:MAG: Unknown protein [uncultured Thiotrichaceae bacterium]